MAVSRMYMFGERNETSYAHVALFGPQNFNMFADTVYAYHDKKVPERMMVHIHYLAPN